MLISDETVHELWNLMVASGTICVASLFILVPLIIIWEKIREKKQVKLDE